MFLRWFTHNFANTAVPTHADLQPLELSANVAESIKQFERVVAQLRGWKIVSASEGTVRLTRSTRLLRFVDDVTLALAPSSVGTLVHFESRSRVGVGDFGQNRRNILELQHALRKAT